jgi:hypothetical protein
MDESSEATPARRKRRFWPVIAGIAFVLVLGVGGFVTASALEEHDTFCTSCHTVPETTYFNRAYVALDNPQTQVTDLATAHYHLSQQENKPAFSCISCHRGDASLGQRISTLALAGRDTLIYVLGKEDPTIEKEHTKEGWLPNAACVSCHTDTLLTLKGLDNHFHTHLPQAAAALANGGTLIVSEAHQNEKDRLMALGLQTVNTPLVCSDCHQAHATLANGAAVFFMDAVRRDDACVSCHHIAQKGPQDASSLK